MPRVYTTNYDETIDQIVRRNILVLVLHAFPDSILALHSNAYKEPDLDNTILNWKDS